MQVTFDGCPHIESALDKGLLLLTQLLQVFGHLPIHSLGDHRCGLGPNPRHLCPAALFLMMRAFLHRHLLDDICGASVSTHPIGIGTRAFQQISDLPQGLCWIHSDRLRRGRGLS